MAREARSGTSSFYLPMRDGVQLAVDLSLPHGLAPGARIPAILEQTRYFRAVQLRWPLRLFTTRPRRDLRTELLTQALRRSYAVVEVDVRGSGASFGQQPHPWSPESVRDGATLLDWIVAQPWSDGRVVSFGVSYSGTTAELLAQNRHPALRAIIASFHHFDPYAGIGFPGGIFNERFIRAWAETTRALDDDKMPDLAGLLGRIAVVGVKPVDTDPDRHHVRIAVQQHATNGDIFSASQGLVHRDDPWALTGEPIDAFSVHQARSSIAACGTPILAWGSWLDADTADTILLRFINLNTPQHGVIGPWGHGGATDSNPYAGRGAAPAAGLRAQAVDVLERLEQQLHGREPLRALAYYTLGEERWKSTATWPPASHRPVDWYLAPDHRLSPAPPDTAEGADDYAVDFEATTGPRNRWHTELDEGAVIYRSRAEQDRRLLTYTSAPLEHDLEITGHPVVTLFAASTATDGAFYVYLEEVDPEGRVTYVTDGQLRALHRRLSSDPPPYRMLVPYHSFRRADAMPLVPGEVTELTFGLLPTSVLVRAGHAIRIAIAGHDRDNFARIPATGQPVVTVMRSARHPSRIALPVIPRR